MLSIPEIATQIVNKTRLQLDENNSHTIFIVGSKSVGKTTLLNAFLEKSDAPRETLVLEYSFGRKSNQKEGIEKTICHVFEYGGKLDLLQTVLSSVPIRGKFYFCVMVDISKIKSIWNILETSFQTMNETYSKSGISSDLIILCGKYDLFKNYDTEIKKNICTTLRSVALLCNAHLLFYSSKEPPLVKRAKELFYGIGFGNGVPTKEKNINFAKPMNIPRGTDSWENIGIAASTFDQIKARHLSRFPPDTEIFTRDVVQTGPQHNYPEPALDSSIALKYEQLRNLKFLDMSIEDYLPSLH